MMGEAELKRIKAGMDVQIISIALE